MAAGRDGDPRGVVGRWHRSRSEVRPVTGPTLPRSLVSTDDSVVDDPSNLRHAANGAVLRLTSTPVLTPPARGGRGGLEPSGRWSFALSGGALGSVGPKGRRRRGAAMTTQKTFKRRVRDRMAKTGESYTAARRQLIAGGDQPDPGTPTYETVVSDDRMLEATGKRHEEWFAILDRWGAKRAHPHRDRPLRDRGARRRRLVGPEHHRVLRAGPGPAGRRPDEGRLDDQRQQDRQRRRSTTSSTPSWRTGSARSGSLMPTCPPHRDQAQVGPVRLGGRQHPAQRELRVQGPEQGDGVRQPRTAPRRRHRPTP